MKAENWRVGYHYTSYENWLQIREKGLHPAPLKEAYTRLGVPAGVWVWVNRLRGLSHAGTIMFQAGDKTATTIVLLEVWYHAEDIVRTPNGDFTQSTHDGKFGNLMFHRGERSVVLANRVPPNRIRFVETYDLVAMLAEGRR